MDITEQIIGIVGDLPPHRRIELLEYAQSLQRVSRPQKVPWKSLRGAFAEPGFDITAEDIDQARREMWGNFPREDI